MARQPPSTGPGPSEVSPPLGLAPRGTLARPARAFALAAVLAVISPSATAATSSQAPRTGAPGMREPDAGSLLVAYYEKFLADQDIESFQRQVSARYTEGTLARLVQSGDLPARRAGVLALGLI